MSLPRFSPEVLMEELRELASAGYVETFPTIPFDDLIEMDAHHFVKTASALLEEIAKSNSVWAKRARAVLDRED